jgi:DNA adenine methylase
MPLRVRPGSFKMHKSFLKWAGGKYDLLPTLLPLIQGALEPTGRFIEPFVGGGSVALNVEADRIIINDANDAVVSCWLQLKDNPKFLKGAELMFKGFDNSENMFYRHRESFNYFMAHWNEYEVARFFLYLNRHCFNGLCRFNKKGEFNVPYGRYKTVYFPKAELEHAATVAKKMRIYHGDFADVMNDATQGDVVYCDPPYIPLSATSAFVGYSKGGFTLEDQIRLKDRACRLRDRGVTVIISNNDTPLARELYKDADEVKKVLVSKRISCKSDGRKKQGEVIAVYAP